MLDALKAAAEAAVEDDTLDVSVFDHEPRSQVFFPNPEEPWDEDDVETINLVGEKDVAAKIAYWRDVVNGVGK